GTRSARTPAEGTQASRSHPRTRRLPGLVTRSETCALVPSRTDESPVRSKRNVRTDPAVPASSRAAATRTPSTARTPAMLGSNSPTTTAPNSATRASRPVTTTSRLPCRWSSGSTGHRGRAQDVVQHAVGGDAFHLRLRAKTEPVPQGRAGQRLDVVGRDIVP